MFALCIVFTANESFNAGEHIKKISNDFKMFRVFHFFPCFSVEDKNLLDRKFCTFPHGIRDGAHKTLSLAHTYLMTTSKNL